MSEFGEFAELRRTTTPVSRLDFGFRIGRDSNIVVDVFALTYVRAYAKRIADCGFEEGTMRLAELNELSADDAESHFLDCCGSRAWARGMAEARPFEDVGGLLLTAERVWKGLGADDWLEAFAAHPKIGAKKAAPAQAERSAEWSKGEQAGMDSTTDTVREDLAEANRLYEERFGHIYIVCATGRSAGEMLDICRERLGNTAETELSIAAEEQMKITEIRLRKLLYG